jgi:acetate kinase
MVGVLFSQYLSLQDTGLVNTAASMNSLDYLGLALDCTANDVCQPDADVTLPTSTGSILVIATREDVTIVRETRRLLTRA